MNRRPSRLTIVTFLSHGAVRGKEIVPAKHQSSSEEKNIKKVWGPKMRIPLLSGSFTGTDISSFHHLQFVLPLMFAWERTSSV